MKYAVLVLALLAALSGYTQLHSKDFFLKRSLKQDGLHYQFSILDADKKGVRRYNPNKFYHWIKAQHVLSTQGASSGVLLHGTFEAFYPDKQLARKGSYHKGLKHGKWMYWSENGLLLKTESWRHGKQCGKQLIYDDSGKIHETHIIHGNRLKKIGADSVIVQKLHHKKKVITKDSIGRKEAVKHYQHNELHGKVKHFEDGKLISKEKYKKGQLVQKTKEEKSPESETEKEPGKIQTIWKRIFSKDKESKEKKERDKKPQKKKDKQQEE